MDKEKDRGSVFEIGDALRKLIEKHGWEFALYIESYAFDPDEYWIYIEDPDDEEQDNARFSCLVKEMK